MELNPKFKQKKTLQGRGEDGGEEESKQLSV
jgi:hypothetical protein